MKQDSSFPFSDDAGEFTLDRLRQSRLRIGLKDVSREEWQAAVREQAGSSVHLDIELEPDVFAWLKSQAGGQDCRKLINATLRKAMENQARQVELVGGPSDIL